MLMARGLVKRRFTSLEADETISTEKQTGSSHPEFSLITVDTDPLTVSWSTRQPSHPRPHVVSPTSPARVQVESNRVDAEEEQTVQ